MERLFKILVGSKKVVYGRLRGRLGSKLVIFVHGLGGNMDEHIFFNGARWFEHQGLPSFRFNLYGEEKDARKLLQATLRSQAADLDAVVAFFRRHGVKKIYVVGHSYGGPTVVLSKRKNFKAAVLWDPTYEAKSLFKPAHQVSSKRVYIMPWGVDILVGSKMRQEGMDFDIKPFLKSFCVPVRVICAGKGILVSSWKKYLPGFGGPKSLVVVPGATHNFHEDGAEDKLFHATLAWFKQEY